MSLDLNTFLQTLLSTQTPALPDLAVSRMARYASWAVVLACAAMLAGRTRPRWLQLGLAGLMLVWTLVPGPSSPAFWLGLAYQMPSLLSTLLALCVLWRLLKSSKQPLHELMHSPVLYRAAQAGVLLGWLLLLDTFAVLPFSLYAAGFSPATLAVCVLLAGLPWMAWGARPGTASLSLILLTVLLLHVLLRLPTGNVWDALLDPWLWLFLQLAWLLRGVRTLSAKWRASKATRA